MVKNICVYTLFFFTYNELGGCMKKNKIFVNKIKKKIDNNQKYFNISEEDVNDTINKEVITKVDNNLTVREKINQLLDRNGYIFNVNVKIITNQKEYNTFIAGIVNNHVVTLDKDIINISDIKDIIINE